MTRSCDFDEWRCACRRGGCERSGVFQMPDLDQSRRLQSPFGLRVTLILPFQHVRLPSAAVLQPAS